MKFIDLFAGIGGFRRGMELAGHECIGFCEWDKYAAASYISMHLLTEGQREKMSAFNLKKRQKEILKDEYRNGEWYSNDIRNVDAGSVPKADCWCFGAPCQDFSIAGKRAGLGGDRSSLVKEVFRILGEIRGENRPEWLIYENVKGMLSSNRGLLLKLPCKVGDTVWYINERVEKQGRKKVTVFFIDDGRVDNITLGSVMIPQIEVCNSKENSWITFDCKEDWNKIVFLTQEEAEEALKI